MLFLRVFTLLWVATFAGAAPLFAAAAELQPRRTQPDDLAFSGPFRGVPVGETRYLSRASLLRVPGVTRLRAKLTPKLPEAELTVLPLPALLEALPIGGDADGLLLTCEDRWQSVLPLAFVRSHAPYLLLLYDGRTPAEGWPKFSDVEAFAPYYVDVDRAVHPAFDGIIDEGMISATQVIEIRAMNVSRHYAPFHAGALGQLSPQADAGRKIFIRACNNCHQGPGGVGGNTSQRPLAVLQAHATANEDYFRKLVRKPKDFFPNTVMPPHPHFGEEMFGHLIAFLRESGAAAAATPVATAGPKVAEGFSFSLERVPFDHQGPQLVDLAVRLSYIDGITQKDYPDFEAIHREILAFLAAYPKNTDYIETVNRKLCLELLGRYPVVTTVAIDMRTHPTMTVSYFHTAHAAASR
jgi:cytochrome c2